MLRYNSFPSVPGAGRGLSVYQMVLYGALAAGAVLWGVLAGGWAQTTFLLAAVVRPRGDAIRLWPLFETSGHAAARGSAPEPIC
jgi:hypothetical protein